MEKAGRFPKSTYISPNRRVWFADEIIRWQEQEARLMVGNVIRIMCRAPKSRAGCHFAAAIGLRSLLEEYAPAIPDWANDQHTLTGRKLGRGLDHFRKARG